MGWFGGRTTFFNSAGREKVILSLFLNAFQSMTLSRRWEVDNLYQFKTMMNYAAQNWLFTGNHLIPLKLADKIMYVWGIRNNSY